jgi:hypothetical protein
MVESQPFTNFVKGKEIGTQLRVHRDLEWHWLSECVGSKLEGWKEHLHGLSVIAYLTSAQCFLKKLQAPLQDLRSPNLAQEVVELSASGQG